MVKKINETEFNAMDKAGIKVIDFNATWCGPCQMLKPVLEELSNEYEGQVEFLAVDTDENPGLAQQYKIVSIPALILLKDGQQVDMSVGFLPKPQLKSFIDGNL